MLANDDDMMQKVQNSKFITWTAMWEMVFIREREIGNNSLGEGK